MLGVRQWRHGAFCVSRQHKLCGRCPRRIFMYYSWNAVVFIHRLWNNVCNRWITNNQQAQQVPANPRRGKIFRWNSSGERRLKFIGQRIEEDNCEAERTSLSTAKATTLEKKIKPWDGLNGSWKLVKNFNWQVTYNDKYWMRLNRSVKFFKSY